MHYLGIIRWDRHWPVIVFSIAAMFIAISLSWLLLPDEVPLEWHERWAQESPAPDSYSPGFFYLMGIHVAEEADPESYGKARLDAWRGYEEGLCAYWEREEAELCTTAIDAVGHLPLPPDDSALLCSVRDQDCYYELVSHTEQVAELLNEYRPLLQRYEALYHYPAVAGSLPVALLAPKPEYEYLASGHRLKLLSILALQWEEGTDRAIHELLAYLNSQRGHLHNSLEMYDRLMRLGWLEDSLSLLLMLHAQTPLKLAPVERLSAEESAIDTLVWRDFTSRISWLRELAEVEFTFSRPQSLFDMLLMRIVYKPNTTINHVYRKYVRLIDAARLSPSEFTALREREEPDEEFSKLDYMRNSMGIMYASGSMPSMRWIAAVHNLQAKIDLVNAMLQHDPLEQANYPLLNSPFGEELSWLDDGASHLCVHGARFSCGRDKVCVPYPTTGMPN